MKNLSKIKFPKIINSNLKYFCTLKENENLTNFGFKTVKKEDRQTLINTVFASVAEKYFVIINRYDIMNDVMSMGIHRIWKNEFVNSIGLLKPNQIFNDGIMKEEKMKIIDVAGGTGDIAFKIWNRADYFAKQNYSTHIIKLAIHPIDLTVVDINANMLEVGKQRANEMGIRGIFISIRYKLGRM